MEKEWDVVRNDRGSSAGYTSMGILRIALLFGSAAVALALIIAPIADSKTRSYVAQDGGPVGVDTMTTGSIKGGGSRDLYTIRRSVLQSSPDAVCVIRADGSRTGDC
jgi:lipopolysaccharide export LptBFGC system permease protein LptF